MTTILDELVVFEGAYGLTNRALRDTGVDEFKFKYSIVAVDTLGCGALAGEGETLLDTMAEVGVDISPKPSPKLYMKKLKGTPIPGRPNERMCTNTRSLRLVRGDL